MAGLAAIARKCQVESLLIQAIIPSNAQQRQRMVAKLRELVGPFAGRTICLLGLSFKPDADDLREAPALGMIEALQAEGATVRAYDPAAMEKAQQLFPQLVCCESPYQAAEGADALVLMTEWNEFRNIDLAVLQSALKAPRMLDCRNLYHPRQMQEMGFEYLSVGRPPRRPGQETPEKTSDWLLGGYPLRR